MHEKYIQKFWSKVDKRREDECWNWKASCSDRGYGQFNGFRKRYRSHRLAWELTNGPIPEGIHVCHSCDNPKCCNPRHLFLGTHQDNMEDMIKKGRHGMIGKPLSEEHKQKIKEGVARGYKDRMDEYFKPENVAAREATRSNK